jgi:hypothetical protein
MSKYITSHGIEFIRHGKCAQCGFCGCAECAHYEWRDGKSWCRIYDQRDEYCEECGLDHAGCADFPDNPWIWGVRDRICAYWFERVDGGSMDDLPFLYGEPYLRT